MKNIWLIGAALLMLSSCQKEPSYVIKGHFQGAPDGTTIYLNEDSTTIVNGEFIFKGRADLPLQTYLQVKGLNAYGMPGYRGTPIWLENTEMTVVCPWEKLPDVYDYSEEIKVSGSPLNDSYQNYRKEVAAIGTRDSLWTIYQDVYLVPSFEWKNVDVKAGMEVMKKIQQLQEKKRLLGEKFIAENPVSPISVKVLSNLLSGQAYTVAEAQHMMAGLDPSLKKLPNYAELTEAFQNFAPTAKGEKYTDITLRDKNGKEVKLSDYIVPGKYNMLEFWASWCGPCRGEIPHLRHVNEVLGKDFNIISISIDEKDADWQKAMQEEGMVWTQLNVPDGFEGEASQKYGIHLQGVPYSLVLDGEGKIIAGEARGAELDIILSQLLGEEAQKL